jgi:hypothetical protein
MTTIRMRVAAGLTAAALSLAAPVAAQETLTFESVATNAAGFNATPFTGQSGFQFENWGVLTSGSVFGTGTNASSGSHFAYGFAGAGSSYIYRTDINFNLASAFLSFRTFDGNVDPAEVIIRGYRGPDEVFTRTLSLTSSAQLFALGITNVEEIEFETSALDGTRSAVLTIDDVSVSAVPEPGTIVLTLTGLGAVGGVATIRRRRARAA